MCSGVSLISEIAHFAAWDHIPLIIIQVIVVCSQARRYHKRGLTER